METNEATAHCVCEACKCVSRGETACCVKYMVEQFTCRDWAVRTCLYVNAVSQAVELLSTARRSTGIVNVYCRQCDCPKVKGNLTLVSMDIISGHAKLFVPVKVRLITYV